jgi:cytochrome c oxidase assembly factor CtaG
VLGRSLDLTIWLPLVAAAAAYLWAVRRVNAAHPANPVPWDRPAFFLLGLAAIAIAIALQSGIERYDTTLFSVHLVQHVILIFLAAPAIVLAAPITLVLRVATPGTRRRWILPILQSRAVRLSAQAGMGASR